MNKFAYNLGCRVGMQKRAGLGSLLKRVLSKYKHWRLGGNKGALRRSIWGAGNDLKQQVHSNVKKDIDRGASMNALQWLWEQGPPKP